MALFGYLFDNDYKRKVREDQRRHESRSDPETYYDPDDERRTIQELREDLGRTVLLNRVLIRALVGKGTLTLEELTQMAHSIDLEEDAKSSRPSGPQADRKVRICEQCGRPNFRFRTSCVYCGSLQY